MKKNIYSIILSSTYPIIFFYVNNIRELSLIFLKTPLLLSVSATLIFSLLLYLILKNANKTTLIVCTILTVFYSYGHISNSLTNKLFIPLPGGFVIGPDKVLLPLVLLLIVAVIYKIIKSKSELSQFIIFINIFITLLFTNPLYKLVKVEINREKNNNQLVNLISNQNSAKINSPDIYHIILDGYARNDVLKKYYDYDNSNFALSLEKMGFFVASQSRSNYMHTYLSLPSTFNMSYLDNLPKTYGKTPSDNLAAIDLMLNNTVKTKLKNYGYKTVNFVSDWSGTNQDYVADIVYNEASTSKILGINILVTESSMVFLKTTLISPLIKDVWQSAIRQKTLSVFNKIPDVAYLDGPKYVLAHIMSPHPPYVFQADGSETVDPRLVNADEGLDRRPFYLSQLKFVSNQTINIIQKIISNSQSPPIIIIQSDHGPASIFGSREDWSTNYSPDALHERSSILYAILLPDKNYSKFYKTITPINTYPIIFNQFFNENNSLLPDKSYYTNYSEIYGFYEI